MKKDIIYAIKSGLKGEFIHSNPKELVKGLTPEIARKKSDEFDHSCWDLLHHIVIWQDIFINNIKGKIVSWNPDNNWPTSEELKNDNNFYKLVERFKLDISEVESLLESSNIDFTVKTKINQEGTSELSAIKLYMAILQHMSYHIGQLATLRKVVDSWPAKKLK